MTFLARFSLANRSLIALASLAVMVFGLVATVSIKQELIPSISLPVVSVSAPYPGASPEIVERNVTEPLERAVQSAEGQEGFTSYSSQNAAVLVVQYDFGTDIDEATSGLQQAIGRIQGELPDGVTPTVMAGSSADLPVVQLAVTSGGDQHKLADRLERSVIPSLESIDGVREASVTGKRDQVVRVDLDPDELKRRGLTADSVGAALRTGGTSLPAGSVTQDGRSLSVQVGEAYTSVKDIENIRLMPPAGGGAGGAGAAGGSAGAGGAGGAMPGGAGAGAGGAMSGGAGASGMTAGAARVGAPKPVELGDIAYVRLADDDATSLTRTNGQPSLGVMVQADPDGNTVQISHEVQDRLAEMRQATGGDVVVVFDQAPFIEQSIEDLTTEGLLGLGFAALIILVFLLSVRSTLVTIVSIPLSLLVAMLTLWSGDFSLNLLTLGALTIAVGRVVDDSIVVIENIKRHLAYGEEKRAAILAAVREVAGAVTASTITTVAVFLPIAFTGGMVGELFSAFSLTVTIALLASLFVALTIVPVLAYWFLKAPKTDDLARARAEAEAKERRGPLQWIYVPIIRFATRFRLITVLLAIGVFAGTMALVPKLQTSFIDDSGQNTFTVTQKLPPGSALSTTDKAAGKVEDVIADVEGVESYQVNIGGGGGPMAAPPGMAGGGSGTSSASFSITTDPDADQDAIKEQVRTRVAGLSDVGEVTVSTAQEGGFGNKVDVQVAAPDEETLREANEQVLATVREAPGATDVSSDLSRSGRQIEVRADPDEAAQVGLTEAQIGQVVARAVDGEVVTQADVAGESRDVKIKLDVPAGDADEIRRLDIATPTGRTVQLADVADVTVSSAPTQVTRVDGERSATVSATPNGQDIGALTTDLQTRIDRLNLPAGATASLGGVAENQQEAFASLGLALVAAVVIVYLVMVGTFRSLIHPLALLVSIPFAMTGAIGLLVITDTPLGVAALIGALMLVGIVVTNAIVLLDLIRQYREQGMGIREAVIEGGRHRVRPVLMTAVATICALTPMALGLTGGGAFISQPLAMVVIGGLVSSTLLTLVLVPTLYSIIEGIKERSRRRRTRGSAGGSGEAQPKREPVKV